eukprot:1616166-Amphidinium_carterae.1
MIPLTFRGRSCGHLCPPTHGPFKADHVQVSDRAKVLGLVIAARGIQVQVIRDALIEQPIHTRDTLAWYTLCRRLVSLPIPASWNDAHRHAAHKALQSRLSRGRKDPTNLQLHAWKHFMRAHFDLFALRRGGIECGEVASTLLRCVCFCRADIAPELCLQGVNPWGDTKGTCERKKIHKQ